jgi:hypothetical protein
VIYFIQDSSSFNIKIGCTSDVQKRLSHLQTGNSSRLVLLGTAEGDAVEEHCLHQLFGKHKIRGEWFSPAPAIILFLMNLKTTPGETIRQNFVKRGPRTLRASEWLVKRFREKLEWSSSDLFSRAKQDGIGRNAILEAKETLDLPEGKIVVCPNGDQAFFWHVPPDWPHLAESDSHEGSL